MNWTAEERATLIVLGVLLVSGLAVLGWQRRRAPIQVGGQPVVSTAAWDGQLSAARAVDVNTADGAELERLPGVGRSLALRIVADRQAHGPFTAPEELARVSGIGPKLLSQLEGYVSIGDRQ